ncbi:MAG TPA: class I SAM-dependent methyltransferase [Chloroflexia bacterium]|nr:class I SAM-dependent methyltransferase [Chloroflexia bacterium]
MMVRDAYDTWAATYDVDRNLTRDLDAYVTRQVLGSLRLSADCHILELGCGTGKNTGFLSQMGSRAYALDFSEAMIKQAQAKVRQPNVSFAVADLSRRWPVAGRSVDLVVCNLVLEHLEDLAFVFNEAARSLRSQQGPGRLFVCELHPFRQYMGGKARLERDGEKVEVSAFVHHISEFLEASSTAGLALVRLDEWWHEEDAEAPPRLVSFLFEMQPGRR